VDRPAARKGRTSAVADTGARVVVSTGGLFLLGTCIADLLDSRLPANQGRRRAPTLPLLAYDTSSGEAELLDETIEQAPQLERPLEVSRCLSDEAVAAVDAHDLSGDPLGCGVGEGDDPASDIVGVSAAAERDLSAFRVLDRFDGIGGEARPL
jgi:hypothetical protein